MKALKKLKGSVALAGQSPLCGWRGSTATRGVEALARLSEEKRAAGRRCSASRAPFSPRTATPAPPAHLHSKLVKARGAHDVGGVGEVDLLKPAGGGGQVGVYARVCVLLQAGRAVRRGDAGGLGQERQGSASYQRARRAPALVGRHKELVVWDALRLRRAVVAGGPGAGEAHQCAGGVLARPARRSRGRAAAPGVGLRPPHQPVVPRRVFQVPRLAAVREQHAKALARPKLLHVLAQRGSRGARASGGGQRQNDGRKVVLYDLWVGGQMWRLWDGEHAGGGAGTLGAEDVAEHCWQRWLLAAGGASTWTHPRHVVQRVSGQRRLG